MTFEKGKSVILLFDIKSRGNHENLKIGELLICFQNVQVKRTMEITNYKKILIKL